MTKQTRITNEIFLYSLIFILGLTVRLILLGENPLTESEASWAYQAWQIWKGLPVKMGSLVSYLSITEGLYSVFGSSNFSARLWPAFSGSLLIWIPYLSRKNLGRVPALIMAGGLALDPTLVTVSRIAGSPIPGLVYLLLFGIFFHHQRISWSLLFLFLGLSSGPVFWLGAGVLGITVLITSRLGYLDLGPYLQERFQVLTEIKGKQLISSGELFFPLLLALAIGTFFFSHLSGLSSWASSLPEFFLDWGRSSGISIFQVLTALVLYNPLLIIFGGLGFLSAWKNNERNGKILSLWSGIALILILINPGRQTTDLIWVVIPLWASTAKELIRLYRLFESTWYTNILAGLVATLFTLNWLTFTGMLYQVSDQRTILLHWGLIVASLALAFVAMTIVASEWGWPAAKKGAVVGICAVLWIYSLSALSQGAFQHAGDPRSLLTNGTGSGQMDLLLDTISDISISETGRWDSIEGAVFNPSNALLWVLRDLQEFQYYESFDPGILAPVIITRKVEEQLIPSNMYRGQDFILATWPGWTGVIPDDWISWVAFRKGPLQNEYIILWVRNDLVSGN